MKTVLMTAIMLFVTISMLPAQAIDPSEIRVGKRPGADEQGTVNVSASNPSEAEMRIVKDLREARIAGDRATACTLQASLDRMHGEEPSTSSPASKPPVVYTGPVEGGGSPSAPIWNGDVLITDPSKMMLKPSIACGEDGTLFAAAEDHNANRVYIYRSTDGGMSWDAIKMIMTGDEVRNPSLAYADDGAGEKALYIATEVLKGNLHGVLVTHWNLVTNTMSNTYVEWGFTLLGPEQVYPRICTDYQFYSGYYVYVTYAKLAADYYPVMFSRSTDLGTSFTTPKNITGGAENSLWVTRPDIDYGQSGLFVAFEKLGWNGSSWENQPWVVESNDYGSTFPIGAQLAASSNPGTHPTVAVAPNDDYIVVAYNKNYGSDMDVNCAYSTDNGDSWNTEISLPWSYDNEFDADICVSHGNDRFHAAYFQDFNNIRYVHTSYSSLNSWDPGTFINDVEKVSNTWPRPSICVDLTKSADDEACVAWTDYRNAGLGAYFDRADDPSLTADKSEIPVSTGGTVNFTLNAGASNGGRNYLLLGSVSGVTPGTALPGGYAVLPLNWDAFTDLVLEMINSPVFSNFMGTLNGSGQAQAQLNAPPLSAAYVGLEMDYAFCLNNLFDFASNAKHIEFIP